MSEIQFQYPIWFLVFCVLIGLGLSFGLYFRDQSKAERSKLWNALFGILRFLTGFILSLLLLSPLLKNIESQTQKPIVVIAQDNSESIRYQFKDSLAYQTAFKTMTAELAEKYDVQQFSIGSALKEGISFDFTEKETNLSKAVSSIYDQYADQNLGAVILASDGIYNVGSSPLYIGAKLNAPIYTIGLGDTTIQKDIFIKKVFHNKIAYLEDQFTIQVDVLARNFTSTSTDLSIYKVENGQTKLLQKENILIQDNDYFTTKEITLNADKAGVQRYRIQLSSKAGEASVSNNVKDIFIDVLDARQKILLLANAAHPDLKALKASISQNKNYEVTIAYANETIDLQAYDFTILHQLPSKTNRIEPILKQLYDLDMPRLYIMGAETDINHFGKIQAFIDTKGDNRNLNDVQAKLSTNFGAFKMSEALRTKLPKFPPLTSPFGEYKLKNDGQVLLYQKIGSVETEYPLLLMGEKNDTKVGVLTAEGIWKWRLFNYLQYQNHEIVDELVGSTVQYLSIKEDKRQFRVTIAKNLFKENESIVFDAELYNENYELVNEADVSLVVKSSDGKEFPFIFNKSTSTYTLNAGFFPVGNYTYNATVNYGGKQQNHTGQFSVQTIQLETFETTANHNLLNLLSNQFGGKLVMPQAIASIPSLLEEGGQVKPVLYSTVKTRPIIHLKWICFLLLAFLATEWFGRRYNGGY